MICSNVLQRVSIHKSFWCKKLGFCQNHLRMIISEKTSIFRRHFFRAGKQHHWNCGFCVSFWFFSLLSPSSVCASGSSLLGHLVAWLSFPLPLKKPTRNCPTIYFSRPMKSFNYCNSFNLCFNFVFFLDCRNSTVFFCRHKSPKRWFFSVSWWGQRFSIEDHLAKWLLKYSTGRDVQSLS